MRKLVASMPGKVPFLLLDEDGLPLSDSEVTSLSYSIWNLTEGVEQKASTAITPAVASGTIALNAVDTTLQGTGDTEQLRLCLVVDTEYKFPISFLIVEESCAGS
jgi:hypothetical protein